MSPSWPEQGIISHPFLWPPRPFLRCFSWARIFSAHLSYSIQKVHETYYSGDCGAWSILHLVGTETGATTIETVRHFFKQVKNRTTYPLPSNPTSGYTSEEDEFTFSKSYLHPHVHCIHRSSQDTETTECPLMDGWIKKSWYRYTTEYYSAVRKRKSCPL